MKTIALVLAAMLVVSAANAEVKPVEFALDLTYAGLAITDTALTIYGTSHLGLIERNSLWAPLFEKRQYAVIWACEAVSTVAIVGLCHWLIASDEKMPRIIGYAFLAAAVVFRGWVVIKNLQLHSRVL